MLGVEATEPEEHTYTEIVDAIRVHGLTHKQISKIVAAYRLLDFDYECRRPPAQSRLPACRSEFWRLSPAFDINPSPERVRELKTWISEMQALT